MTGKQAQAIPGIYRQHILAGVIIAGRQHVGIDTHGGGPGAEYELVGHKWFCSAPMCDAFLVLAQADGGISCFLFPRWTPDGERNRFRLQRLKDKLGNRSNASSEVEFDAASAWLIGEEGAGVRTIIEMVNHTRLDCVMGGATGMRAGVAQAIHHAGHRSVFGRELVEQWLRHLGRGGGDDDRVERRDLGPAEVAVADPHVDLVEAEPLEVVLGPLAEAVVDLDRVDLGR